MHGLPFCRPSDGANAPDPSPRRTQHPCWFSTRQARASPSSSLFTGSVGIWGAACFRNAWAGSRPGQERHRSLDWQGVSNSPRCDGLVRCLRPPRKYRREPGASRQRRHWGSDSLTELIGRLFPASRAGTVDLSNTAFAGHLRRARRSGCRTDDTPAPGRRGRRPG